MSIDTIGDFLTIIRNAVARSRGTATAPYSRLKQQMAELLKNEGFIRDFAIEDTPEGHKRIKLFLKYVNGEAVIHEISRVSRPGQRIYEGSSQLRRVVGGLGVSIVTTSRGIMTDKEARQRNVGGEVLCMVW